jgi:Uma2 family endonuclease
MSVQIRRFQFSRNDFARMRQSGIFGEDDRVELIDGEVVQMSAVGSRHVAIVNRLTALLTSQLSDRVIVSVQNRVVLNDFTEPQPDLVVLRPRDDFYADSLAGPEDSLLVIEVADSSLEYDRDEKIPRYGQMRIPEAWFVDINGQAVVRYSEPAEAGYQEVREFVTGTELQSVAIGSLRIAIDTLFHIAGSSSRG